ncbi:ATP-binding cassette domain-containing protein [Hymenobacter setariae]|uniref:ATP-binding cassette domain-containing protein n=1 Tax=Hymenobacter setariae TaxID=2594794 RepID=A0A558C207_9BACT|nr:polysaccharide ABC transporter ATP-binding protein [Hymenobacter setariae]TVT42809.1 ATP-binding cassette domain-containing protein [Hymenobacter setariae]
MSDIAIQIENLSKLYRLGTIGTGSLRQDMQRWWTTSVRKKADPYFQVESAKYPRQSLWALQDVSFEVKQGEVWGLVGNNGAGKSTLLKIVSRIVRPTQGVVRGRGRISSLLEVGTGFQPELTGRENVFLSGYILGMSKPEIRARFDEIVAFSGIEKFLDTPVKRYSSGMYVRLAFAVAAHLEPDILILDEVLAVGDAEFQKKCLGKMREVSQNTGRTILFVSHSMQAVTNLCNKGLWLQQGKVRALGEVSQVVNQYLADTQQSNLSQSWSTPETAPGNDFIRFKRVQIIPQQISSDAPLDIRVPLTVKFEFWNQLDDTLLSTNLVLFSNGGECIFDVPSAAVVCQQGVVAGECTIPGNFLNDGAYYISLFVVKDTTTALYDFENCLSFELEDYRGDIKWYGKWWGAVRPLLPFSLTQTESVLS